MLKLKNRKAASKDEFTGEMIIGGGDRIWKLCNIACESGVVSEDWRSAVIIPLYKGKGERTQCSLLSVIGKIYAGILEDRVRKVTEGLIDEEERVSDHGGVV